MSLEDEKQAPSILINQLCQTLSLLREIIDSDNKKQTTLRKGGIEKDKIDQIRKELLDHDTFVQHYHNTVNRLEKYRDSFPNRFIINDTRVETHPLISRLLTECQFTGKKLQIEKMGATIYLQCKISLLSNPKLYLSVEEEVSARFLFLRSVKRIHLSETPSIFSIDGNFSNIYFQSQQNEEFPPLNFYALAPKTFISTPVLSVPVDYSPIDKLYDKYFSFYEFTSVLKNQKYDSQVLLAVCMDKKWWKVEKDAIKYTKYRAQADGFIFEFL